MTDARARRRKAVLALVAVLALGAGGLALWLRSGTGDAIPSDGHGGGGGEATAPEALPEDPARGLAPNPGAPSDRVRSLEPPAAPGAAPSSPAPPIHLPESKDIRISVVDAVTGRPLDGSALDHPLSLVIGEAWTRAGPGANARLTPIVAAKGFVAWEPAFFEFAPGLATEGLSLVYPLHRTIDLDVAVVDAEQRPADGVDVIAVAVDRRRFGGKVVASGAGRFRVHDLPYVPGSRVALEMTWVKAGATEAQVVEAESVLGARPAWSGRMPDVPAPSFGATVTLHGGRIRETGGVLLDHESSEVARGLGTIHVRVRSHDGEPARDVRILLKPEMRQVVTVEGECTLDRIGAGAVTVSLIDPRLVPTTSSADVREGETVEIDLVEREAAGIDVTVLDADGKAVPVARVEVETPSGMPALDLVDGVLRLDPYTDGIGRRTFTRVEPGVVTVRAWGRGGTGETQVTLRPGLRSAVTVAVK